MYSKSNPWLLDEIARKSLKCLNKRPEEIYEDQSLSVLPE
jgi:hypothetical protein